MQLKSLSEKVGDCGFDLYLTNDEKFISLTEFTVSGEISSSKIECQKPGIKLIQSNLNQSENLSLIIVYEVGSLESQFLMEVFLVELTGEGEVSGDPASFNISVNSSTGTVDIGGLSKEKSYELHILGQYFPKSMTLGGLFSETGSPVYDHGDEPIKLILNKQPIINIDPKNGNSTKILVIVLSVVGGVLLITGLGIIIYCRRRR